MRVIIINNIIAPYCIPLFNVLAGAEGMQLEVIFLAERDRNRAWKIYRDEIRFPYKVLSNIHFFVRRFDTPFYFHWGLWSELKRFDPDVICICGYHYIATWEVLLYARHFRKKAVLWTGSHLTSGHLKGVISDYYKRKVISSFDAYVTYGTAAQEQILYYGADPRKIIIGCNTVDVNYFVQEANKCRENMNIDFFDRFPSQSILYVGDPSKWFDVLIRAFERIQKSKADVGLIIIGDGPERGHLSDYVDKHRIRNVFFQRFVQKEDIIKYYVAADVFVLPSFNEVWGLVVNEAMACGLPVVCSKHAGVTKDLVVEGRNGYSFDPNNVDDLIEKLLSILDNNFLREQMGKESLKLISQRDVTYYANGILKAIMLPLKDDVL